MPGVITKVETSWTEYLQGLGDIVDSPGRALLSVIGWAQERGEVCVEPYCSDDTLPFDVLVGKFSAYDVRDRESLIPFHLKCFDLFQQALAFKTGSPSKTRLLLDGSWEQVIPCQSLDKDLLYRVLWDLIGKTGQRLQISYGDPEPPLTWMWKAKPGMELLVADPNQKNDLVREMILDAWLRIDHYASNQSRNHAWYMITRQHDPLAQLPFEILLMITSALDASSLVNLLHASPYAHRAFDGDDFFGFVSFRIICHGSSKCMIF